MKFKLKVRLTKQAEQSATDDYSQQIADGKTPIEALNQMAEKSERSAAVAAAIVKKYGGRNGKTIAREMAATGSAPTDKIGTRALTDKEKTYVAQSVHQAMTKAAKHCGADATPLSWAPKNAGAATGSIGGGAQATGHDGGHYTAHADNISPGSQPDGAGLVKGTGDVIPPVPLGIDVSAFMQTRDSSLKRVGISDTPMRIMRSVVDPLKRKNQLAGKLVQALAAITKNRTVRDQEDGELDMDKLSDIATGNNIQRVFQQVTLGKRLDSVVQILVDFSSSMSEAGSFPTFTPTTTARESRYSEQATWEALRKHLAKGQYVGRSNFDDALEAGKLLHRGAYVPWDKMIAAVRLCKMLSETFEMLRIPCEIIAYDSNPYLLKNYHERSTMVKWDCLFPGGSTLLPVAILTGINRLRARKEKRKIQIAITDGDLGGMNEEQYKKIDPKREVEIYAFGIGTDFNYNTAYADYRSLPEADRDTAIAEGVTKYLNAKAGKGASRYIMQTVFKKHISGITPDNLEARITETVCQAITGHDLSNLH